MSFRVTASVIALAAIAYACGPRARTEADATVPVQQQASFSLASMSAPVAARAFARAAAATGIDRIVYLGGLGQDSDHLSRHLRSRREVERLLLRAAHQHARVLKEPAPDVILADLGADALQFKLRAWINLRQTRRVQVESDLRFAIEELFTARGIVIASPSAAASW